MHSSRRDSSALVYRDEVAASAPPRLRVLVVDDEPFLRGALRRLLAPEHDVTAVDGGVAALSALGEGHAFDVVLCDVMMPDLSGPELYEAVRASSPALRDRFIFMTGGVFTGAARTFLASVPNPVLAKPFTVDDVRAALKRFVAARALGWPR